MCWIVHMDLILTNDKSVWVTLTEFIYNTDEYEYSAHLRCTGWSPGSQDIVPEAVYE